MPRPRKPELPQGGDDWLANGRRGSSGETIFTTLTGVQAIDDEEMDHPHDAADFWRCRLMFRVCPTLRPRIGEMASVSDEWRALVASWDALERIMDDEMPGWHTGFSRAPLTDLRIHALLDDVAAARRARRANRRPRRSREKLSAAV